MIKLNSAVVTNVGKIRSNNEDNYYINGKYKKNVKTLNEEYFENTQRNAYVYSICDGMGGEAYGEIASMIAVKSMLKFDAIKFSEYAQEYISYANKLICDEIEKNDGARIGTTVALLYINDAKAVCYNIGDSRIYLCRDKKLVQLTRDHTQAQSMVDMGILKQENMNSHKGKHKLTQHLGMFPDETVIQPYVTETIDIKEKDTYIICSDGLTDMLDDSEIFKLVNEEENSKDISRKLVKEAVDRGGKDNTTVITVQVEKITKCQPKKTFWSKIFNN